MKPVFATLQHSSANLVPPSSFTSLFPFDSSSYFQAWVLAAGVQCPFEHRCGGTGLQDWSQPHRNPLLLGTDWEDEKHHGPAASMVLTCQYLSRGWGGPITCWPRDGSRFSCCFTGLFYQHCNNQRKTWSPLSLDTNRLQDSTSWSPTAHRPFSAPQPQSILNARTLPQHYSTPAPQSRPAQWGPQGRWRCL